MTQGCRRQSAWLPFRQPVRSRLAPHGHLHIIHGHLRFDGRQDSLCIVTQWLAADVEELVAPLRLGHDGRRPALGQFLLVEGLVYANNKGTK